MLALDIEAVRLEGALLQWRREQMTKDEFRKYQKIQCSFTYGKRRGKRSIYGCECCMHGSRRDFKKEARRKARVWLKKETRELILSELE